MRCLNDLSRRDGAARRRVRAAPQRAAPRRAVDERRRRRSSSAGRHVMLTGAERTRDAARGAGSTPSEWRRAGARGHRDVGPRRGAHRRARRRNVGAAPLPARRPRRALHRRSLPLGRGRAHARVSRVAAAARAAAPPACRCRARWPRTSIARGSSIRRTSSPRTCPTRASCRGSSPKAACRRTCWRRIGAMIRAVHDHGVDHPDLTAHNVLLDDTGEHIPRRLRQRDSRSRRARGSARASSGSIARCARSRSRPARISTRAAWAEGTRPALREPRARVEASRLAPARATGRGSPSAVFARPKAPAAAGAALLPACA